MECDFCNDAAEHTIWFLDGEEAKQGRCKISVVKVCCACYSDTLNDYGVPEYDDVTDHSE